jgi:hypothetical protein
MSIRRENRLGYCSGCKQSTNQTRVLEDGVPKEEWTCRVCRIVLQPVVVARSLKAQTSAGMVTDG